MLRNVSAMGLALGLLLGSPAAAGVPQHLNHQGILTDDTGVVVPDGPYDLEFGIYDTASAGTLRFQQTLTVNVVGGLYNVLLSSNGPWDLPTAFQVENTYLQIRIVTGGDYSDVTLEPRQQIASVPYALVAAEAESNGAPEPWIAAILLNGWVDFLQGFAPAGYYKDATGIVHLRGLIKSGVTDPGTQLFVLPAGYRPFEGRRFGATYAPSEHGRIHVLPSGKVKLQEGSSDWTSLDGISFRAVP